MFDVAVIGGGVVGAAVCELLSRTDASVCLIEKNTDVADGTTKANSGIVHAGYDARPGTKMAGLGMRGARMMEELCTRLDVPFERRGSLVLSFSEEQDEMLQKLLERGRRNGAEGLEVLRREAALEMEPEVCSSVRRALYAPAAGIVDPIQLCVALAEAGALNGAQILLSSEVTQISRETGGFVLTASGREVRARWIVNAAGLCADHVHRLAGGSGFSIRAVRGEYYLLDKQEGTRVRHIVFQCPTAAGKGVLVSPTVHGNLIVGPNAEDIVDRSDVSTTAAGQQYVRDTALLSVPGIDWSQSIRNFAGVRACASTGDFVVARSPQVPHFINLAGICSPGLTASPAIAEDCLRLLKEDGLSLKAKAHIAARPARKRVRDMTDAELREAVWADDRYGHVVCRCETVTEGEIVEALHRPPVAGTVDSIRKRLGTGMGRCQGGFCTPRILHIMARELDLAPEQILFGSSGSNLVMGTDHAAG